MVMDKTPPLDDFLAAYDADDNEWWRINCGHHQNLFEAAVERMHAAERLLKSWNYLEISTIDGTRVWTREP